MRWTVALAVAMAASVAAAAAAATATATDDRYYVGQTVCRKCHDTERRDQHTPWYLSKHAEAYAALILPESLAIARLSGIDTDPLESPICLGCHTTAADTEEWQRDATFHLEDGVQCERCHGPGSEHASEASWTNPEAAIAAIRRAPAPGDCMVCHADKGSHMAFLEVRRFDAEGRMAEIAHPNGNGTPRRLVRPLPAGEAPRYIGDLACGSCHRGAKGGYVHSKWRLSAHARAYAVLGGERARGIAAEEGVTSDPRAADRCLRCHATGFADRDAGFEETFDLTRGVQCESCHGPGGDYSSETVMLDPVAAGAAGLRPVTAQTCTRCHEDGIHGTTFDADRMLPQVDHSRRDLSSAAVATPSYKTPFNLAVDGSGKVLYVACEASDSLAVVDTVTRRVTAEVGVGNLPHGVCLSPDDSRAYVSNRGSDSVSVVDTRHLEVIDTIAVGDEPHGVVTDRAGRLLYVANAGSADVSVVDLAAGREVKRLAAGRGTWDVALAADGGRLYVTNNLSQFVGFRESSRSEVTVIGTERAMVRDRIVLPDANLVQGVDVSPDGEFALVTLIRTKNLVPMTRVIQGWVLTNGIGVLWRDGRVDQLLLDEPDNHFADPTDLAITPDGRFAYVTGGGVDEVAVLDLGRMRAVLERATADDRHELLPNHLGVATEFVVARIPVGSNPRGVAMAPDGRRVYVADALDDTVSVIDVERRERVAVIDLGGPRELTLARRGERIFHSAAIAFGRQFSCHSCHPDGGIDGITYDIEPDGIGVNPVDNRSLRGVLDTAPFKWTGKNPTLARQCGPRLAVFFTRIDPFTPDQVEALERYICTIPRNPNRYRALGAELTAAQRRGKAIFERSTSNSGEPIPTAKRCVTCHPPPYFTNRQRVSVGRGSELDTHDVFDVPHLTNIYETAPYLHDGRADTLEEIWTRFNPDDEHGVTNDMTKDELNDLIEYLKTL